MAIKKVKFLYKVKNYGYEKLLSITLQTLTDRAFSGHRIIIKKRNKVFLTINRCSILDRQRR